VFDSTKSVVELWRSERVFEPAMATEQREQLLRGWSDAVRRVGDHA